MVAEQPDIPFVTPRRRDRAVEDAEWIRARLREAPFGMLATCRDGQPSINSNLFVLDAGPDGRGDVLYLHTARTGQARAAIEANPRVCFAVAGMGRLLPADEALEFSVEYEGVSVFGRARVVTDREEARRGLQLLLDKYAPHLESGVDYRPITDAELARTAVYRIDIERWSGKRKAVEREFPGAYPYPAAAEGGAVAESRSAAAEPLSPGADGAAARHRPAEGAGPGLGPPPSPGPAAGPPPG